MTLRFRCVLVLVLAAFMFTALSCGHEQQLVSITIVPDTETFGASNIPVSADAGLSVQLRAPGDDPQIFHSQNHHCCDEQP